VDMNTLRIVIELAALAAFIGVVAWAYSARRTEDFEVASRLPFDDAR
jgi:cytochrome c oxidase cbb3-type subunit 4